MKKLCYPILCGILLIFISVAGFAADEVSSVKEWMDNTDKVFANPIEKGGWAKDENGKVFVDKAGNNLKIMTSEFGTMIVDLINKKVSSIEKDGSRTDLEVTKLINREFGLTLVIKTKKFKVRIKMKDKVEGMKNIEGIKAM